MKKILLIPFILLCMMLFTIPACAMKNEPDNFRGIPWGTAPPKNTIFGGNQWGLTEKAWIGKLTIYSRDEEAVIGGVKASAPITYHFHDDRGFVAALAQFKGYENFELIYKACMEIWGEPDSVNRQENNKELDCDMFSAGWVGERILVSTEYYFNTTEDGFLVLGQSDYLMKLSEMSKERGLE